MISIIIPVYNIETYLSDCIDSILSQEYKDFEIILVDDGSTDSSSSICDRYAKLDNRIKTFHTPNGGAAQARNYGISKASGDWVMFVDGDDTLTVGAIKGLTDIAQHNSCDIIVGAPNIICPTRFYKKDQNRIIYSNFNDGEISAEDFISAILLDNVPTGLWGKLFKASVIPHSSSMPKGITHNEDIYLLIETACNANSVYISNSTICYNYISRSNSLSASTMSHDNWIKLFKAVTELIAVRYKPLTDQLKIALFDYKLSRIYESIIVYRQNPHIWDNTYSVIKDESVMFQLTALEQRKIFTLNHRYVQYYLFLKKRLKDLLKSILSSFKRHNYK